MSQATGRQVDRQAARQREPLVFTVPRIPKAADFIIVGAERGTVVVGEIDGIMLRPRRCNFIGSVFYITSVLAESDLLRRLAWAATAVTVPVIYIHSTET